MVDQSIEYEPIVNILEDVLGYYRSHNEGSGQISFDCPVCSYDIKGLDRGDGKSNLEVNYKQEVYKCWSCGDTHDTHGSLYKLIKKYGAKRHLSQFILFRPESHTPIKKTYKEVKLPKEFISFSSSPDAYKMLPQYKRALRYIRKRNITDKMVRKYNIGFCFSGEYENRIIIPSYDVHRKLNYFIGRSYLRNPFMKYKNPEAQKEIIVFNESLINWDEPIYVVEGVFDSLFLPNSIPMLGKHMSDHLFDLLYDKAKKITIVLDGDAWNDAENLYHRLNCGKLMGKVNIVKLPKDKDIADLEGNLENNKEFKLD